MRVLASVMALMLIASSATANEVRLLDADTVVWNGIKFRLDGIDAPETAQKCLDTDGKPWLCGEAATGALTKFIASKNFTCNDVGEDRKYHRRLGRCFADDVSLEHWLVREGWAIEFKKHSDGRFAADELDAKQNGRGIWAGCFTDPRDFRYSNKSSAGLKGRCPTDPAAVQKVRNELFWSGYFVKAKLFDLGRQLASGFKASITQRDAALTARWPPRKPIDNLSLLLRAPRRSTASAKPKIVFDALRGRIWPRSHPRLACTLSL